MNNPYVLVIVRGGVAQVEWTVSDVSTDVDILYYDNLQSTGADDLVLSDREWEYLRENDQELFEFFAPSFAKKDE